MSQMEIDLEIFKNQTSKIVETLMVQRNLSDADGMLPDKKTSDLVNQVNKQRQVAEEISNSVAFKSRFCPAIKATLENAKEHAKLVAAILYALAFGGTLSVKLTPILAAGVALYVMDAGIAAFCADIPKKL